MNDGQAPNALYLLLCIVLVASSLIGMRLSAGKAIRMLLAWVAIFGLAFALFAFRNDFSSLGQRLKDEAIGAPVVEEAGGQLRIPMQSDGHFWVEGSVNGTPVTFLIDSGASVTTISQAVADAGGIETGMRMEIVRTANGTVQMPKARVQQLKAGSIRLGDFPVLVAPQQDLNVLGMNFLSSLDTWGVEGRTLVLQP